MNDRQMILAVFDLPITSKIYAQRFWNRRNFKTTTSGKWGGFEISWRAWVANPAQLPVEYRQVVLGITCRT